MTSHHATAWAWDQECKSAGEKLVLLALAAATGGDEDDPRVCWPSIKRIATLTGMGDSMVRRHMVKLTEDELISKVERRRRSDGSLGTWVITVNYVDAHPVPSAGSPSVTVVTVDQRHCSDALEPVITEPVKVNTRDLAFDEFWKGYPHKASKPAARRAWKKIKPDEDLAVMLGLSLWVAYWKRVRIDKQWIKYPATWLNDRNWEDDVPDADAKAGNERPGARWSETRKIWIQDSAL